MDTSYSLRELHPCEIGMDADMESFLKDNGLHPDGDTDYSVIIEHEGRIVATGSSLKNVIKYVAVEASHRNEGLLAPIFTAIMQHMVHMNEKHIFIYTSPDKRAMFSDMGFYPVAKTTDVLLLENRKSGVKEWLSSVQSETEEKFGLYRKTDIIGAIVVNCDPFTKGHRYLIEYAAANCSLLHLFILSSGGTFSPDERYSMVYAGTSDLDNVILHHASDYVVSPATFPTYFIKARGQVNKVSCALDIEIFSHIISPALHITARFVGTEPYCAVTAEYNEMMNKTLPERGIKFVEIPRFTYAGRAVSASEVRRLYRENNWDELKHMIPDTTLNILYNLPRR